MGAVLLFNASLGSAAFVLSMFLVLKAFNNKSKLIKEA
jgi:hypothetical protein